MGQYDYIQISETLISKSRYWGLNEKIMVYIFLILRLSLGGLDLETKSLFGAPFY